MQRIAGGWDPALHSDSNLLEGEFLAAKAEGGGMGNAGAGVVRKAKLLRAESVERHRVE